MGNSELTVENSELSLGNSNLSMEKSDSPMQNENSNIALQTITYNDSDTISDCLYVELNTSDFKILDNGSVLLFGRKFLAPEHYEADYDLEDSIANIFVCVEYLTTTRVNSSSLRDFDGTQSFNGIQNILSFFCLIISVICLCLHLIVYSLLPALRNVPGMILMSFSTSLALADIFLLFRPYLYYSPWGCRVVGVTLHYLYLSGFFWSNVNALYLYRTFSSVSFARVLGGKNKRFVKYSLFAWGGPVPIVLTSVLLEVSTIDGDYRPKYGQGLCWINQKQPLIILFVVPVAMTVIANVVLLTLTALNVSRIASETKMVNGLSDRKRFVLFVKLATVLGMTWIFGFVAALANVHELWYPFIVLSGLQGAYVFLAFTCNRKTRNILRKKFQREKVTSAPKCVIGCTQTCQPTSHF